MNSGFDALLAVQGDEPGGIFQVLAQLLAFLVLFGLPALSSKRSSNKKKPTRPAPGRSEAERTGGNLWRELLEQAGEEARPTAKPPAKPTAKPAAKPAAERPGGPSAPPASTTREAIERERQAAAREPLPAREAPARERAAEPARPARPAAARRSSGRSTPPELPGRSTRRPTPEPLARTGVDLPSSSLGSELTSAASGARSERSLSGLTPVASEEALERGQGGELGRLGAGLGSLREAVGDADRSTVSRSGAWLPQAGGGWRRAILLSEVLSPPVALRRPGQEPWLR